MGPFEDIGPYAETTITTRVSDTAQPTDNKPGFASVVVALILIGPALWTVYFMGLYLWSYIGVLAPMSVIGLGFWACGHYGTDSSVLDRFRYRTTPSQRTTIKRRLSGGKKV